MSIDWSSAPFDAEAGTAKSAHFFAAWYRRDGKGQVQQICHEAGIEEWTWMGGRKDFPEGSKPRPPAIVPWSGEDLPPAGAVCEMCGSGAWYVVTMLGAGKATALIQYDDGQEHAVQIASVKFRPIRTAEQIAAEERAAAIEEMWATYWKPEPQTAKEALGLLWDAGWRKQVHP